MNLSQTLKYGIENYNSLPTPLQKSVDFIKKVTKDGNDLESYKGNETIKNTIELAVAKMTELKSSYAQRDQEQHERVQELKAEMAKDKKKSQGEKKSKAPKAKYKAGQEFTGNGKYLTVKKVYPGKNGVTYLIDSSDIGEDEISEASLEKMIADIRTSVPKIKTSVKKSAKSVTKKTKSGSKSEKTIATYQVERLPDEITIMKRYVAMQGKSKTPDQVMNLLDALQKAIIEKRIRKTSPYASLINEIQTRLITGYRSMKRARVNSIEIKIDTDFYNKVKGNVDDYQPLKSVALIKRYINLDGKRQTKEKAEALMNQVLLFVQNNPKDVYIENLNRIAKDLAKYVHSTDKHVILNVEEQALAGIPFALIARKAVTAGKFIADGAKKIYSKAKPAVQAAGKKVAETIKQHSAKPTPKAEKKRSSTSIAFPKKMRSNAKLRTWEIWRSNKWVPISEYVFNSTIANAHIVGSYYQDERKGDYAIWYRTKDKDLKGLGSAQETEGIVFHTSEADEIEKLFAPKPRPENIPTFKLMGPLGEFTGMLEQYECGITLEGDQGSGKTQLAYQFANAFLDAGKKVAMLCYELPHDSVPMKRYFKQYVSEVNQPMLRQKSDMPQGLDFIKKIAPAFDVIIIDSWQKTGAKPDEFEHLIKACPNTIFFAIIRRREDGKVKGGNDSKYDGGINIEIEKVDDTFANNYAYTSKNRYGRSGLKYNISQQKLV